MSFLKDFFLNVGTIGLAVSLLLSLGNCFFGYKLMKLWVAVAGFLLGFILGDIVCVYFNVTSYGVFFFIGAVVGGVLAILSFRFYRIGIFLLGAVLGGGISTLVLGVDLWWHIALAVVIGIAVGLLAVLAVKPVVILATAISGGLSALNAGALLFTLAALTDRAPTIILVGGIVLAAAGVAVQFLTNKKQPEA